MSDEETLNIYYKPRVIEIETYLNKGDGSARQETQIWHKNTPHKLVGKELFDK